MKKALSIVLSLALIFGMLPSLGMNNVEAAKDEWNTTRYGDVLDIGRHLRTLENNEEFKVKMDAKLKKMASQINFDEQEGTTEESEESNFTVDGGTKYFLGYNMGDIYLKDYTLRSIGENVEIWVANDLSYEDDRETPVINQEQVDHMRNVFDETVYPTDTDFFGNPDSHTGENATLPGMVGLPQDYYTPDDGVERIMILVDNIKDERYYDQTYPFMIGGFYWGIYERYIDRNIISITARQWETRLDEDWLPTTAHEFQHLIHADNDPGEETWINEGMSDFAQYLCFDEHDWGHVNYFLDHPENSLVWWDEYYSAETGPETLADYGQAYLMQIYLLDQFGKGFIKELATSPNHGIESVNEILDNYGETRDFNDIFRDFSIALAVDSDEPGDGRYNFESIDLKVNFEEAKLTDKDGVPAWGCDYLEINHANKIADMVIDGATILPVPWKVVSDPVTGEGNVLWGGTGDEMSNFLILEADLTNANTATLKFDNYIQIEEQWDFGMVQVSTDNGETWTSLANGNTRDDVVDEGYPTIKENVPGFTGYYDDWTIEEFDLAPYVGEKVHIAFRYMTDWGYNDPGWYIRNIEIPEIGLSYAGDSTVDFMGINELLGNYVTYQMAFINEKSLGKGKNIPNYRVLEIDPFNVTEEEVLTLRDFFSGGNNYMIFWYTAEIGEKEPVEYNYQIITKSDVAKNKKK